MGRVSRRGWLGGGLWGLAGWGLCFRRSMAAILAAGAGCAPERGPRRQTLTLGAFSALREALHDGFLPAFDAYRRATVGQGVRFEESYNASGAQARAIASGFDADLALLSIDPDLDLLERAGIGLSLRRVVARSLVVIGVRNGNPKRIRDWADLSRPGVSVVYADPKTSGGARWNINAIYGAGLLTGGPEASRALLAGVQRNVVTMDGSGRQSLATFLRGTGDALVTYENDLILAARRTGRPIEIVVPPRTLVIECPGAVVDPSVDRHGNRALAEEFLKRLTAPEGQAILADHGFRALDGSVPEGAFTMADLGGWAAIQARLYNAGGVWDSLFTRPMRTRP